MIRPCLIAAALAIIVVLADDIVELKHGRLKGHRLTSRKGRDIFAFQGIPYAKPPVDDLRFKPPQPAESWDDVLDVTKDAPVCLQRGLFSSAEHLTGQEDCLYLNVYTPRVPGGSSDLELLDVMFWIHGGAYVSGSGSSDFYGPQYLLDKDVILVTINYRLGPLGFLSTGDAVCPGNNGLKDQVAALRWVRDNIAAFGGNPNSVTIFGESVGGASVHYHMLSSASQDLFHRAISQSGTTLCSWAHAPNGTTRYQAEKLARLLDCPTEPSEQLVKCLMNHEAADIIATDLSFLEWNFDPMIPFKPVVETELGPGDEAFLTEEPSKFLHTADNLELVPWMTGINSGEGAIMAAGIYGRNGLIEELDNMFSSIIPMAMYFRETAPESEHKSIAEKIRKFYFGDQIIGNNTVTEVKDMYTDAFLLSGTDPAVKLHIYLQRAAPVYYYYFDYRGTNSFSTLFGDPTRDYGVCHLDELMYLFPQSHHFADSIRTPEDEKMVETMTTLWTNFARTGNPTPHSSKMDAWEPVSSASVLEYAHISSGGLHMGSGLLRERANFWTHLPHRGRIETSAKDEL